MTYMEPTVGNFLSWVLRNQPTYYKEMVKSCPLPEQFIRDTKDQLLEEGKLEPYNDWENRGLTEPEYFVVAGSNVPEQDMSRGVHPGDRDHCPNCGDFMTDEGRCSSCDRREWVVRIGIEGYDYGGFTSEPFAEEMKAREAASALFGKDGIEWVEIETEFS